LSAFLPMQSLRAAGLHLIGSVGPLRRLAMREGLAPSWRSSPASRGVMETPAARSE
jgi:2-octaprenyl-6-methoxyphenol hydroxylase